MSQAALAAPIQNPVAALFNLDDPNDRRTLGAIQTFYAPDGRDRLHALRRGTVKGPSGPVRMVWMLNSFHPVRRGAPAEWSVIYWYIDEIAARFQACRDESSARAVYKTATHPDAKWPGVKFEKR